MKKGLKKLSQWKESLGVIAFFLFFTVLMTWPLLPKASDHLWGTGDTHLGVFILDHTIQKIVSLDIKNYFRAPFFYPLENATALSEHVFIQSLLGAPISILFQNPILTYNLVIFLLYLMSGIFIYMLVYDLTGFRLGSLIAGFVYAFLPYRVNAPRLTILTWQFFPLAILYFEKFLKNYSPKNLIIFLLAFSAQALSSWYYFIITFLGFAVYGLVRVIQKRKKLISLFSKKFFLIIAIWLICFLSISYWLAKPYFQLKRDYDIDPQSEGVYLDSLTFMSFLNPGENNLFYGGENWERFLDSNRVLVATQRRWKEEYGKEITAKRIQFLFPGFIAIFLAGIGFFAFIDKKKFFKNKLIISLIITSFVCLVFSLGPYLFFRGHKILLPYYWLRKIPGVVALRDSVRFVVFPYILLAIFVGLGVYNLEKRKRLGRVFIIVFLLLMIGEYFVRPDYEKVTLPENSVYQDLYQKKGDLVVLDLPTTPSTSYQYLIPATVHNKKIVYGYSGFIPQDYKEKMIAINESFPGKKSIDLIKDFQVNYIIFHTEEFGERKKEEILQSIESSEYLEIVKSYPDTYLIEVKYQ